MIALDTNILIYVEQKDDAVGRHHVAVTLITDLTRCGAILPVQVQAEFVNVCVRKMQRSASEAMAVLTLYQGVFDCPDTIESDLFYAALLAERYRLAWFDALICAIARRAGAAMLLSEDLADGLDIDGLKIINPFVRDNAELIARAIAAMED